MYPLSENALVKRINRKLVEEQGQVIRKSRGMYVEGHHIPVGGQSYFYISDVTSNLMLDVNVDIEELGRELGVLSNYEYVEEDEDSEAA